MSPGPFLVSAKAVERLVGLAFREEEGRKLPPAGVILKDPHEN